MHCSGSGGAASRRNLVLGAELLCTRCLNTSETSPFMAGNTEFINNAYLGGFPAGNRTNREVDKDIIPFSQCRRTSWGNELACRDVIITADLWENLNLPFNQVRIPNLHIAITPSGEILDIDGISFPVLERTDSATNLNNPNHEQDFLRHLNDVNRESTEHIDHEARRHRANLRVHTETIAQETASVTTDSILLCRGYGGIIHPRTSGQNVLVTNRLLLEWSMTLKDEAFEGLSPEMLSYIARSFLYDLDEDGLALVISLCFYRIGRYERYVPDVWAVDEMKFDILTEYMTQIVDLESEELTRLVGTPDYNAAYQRHMDIRWRAFLFTSARNLHRPGSAIGMSGPEISIVQNEERVLVNLKGSVPYIVIRSYVIQYRKIENPQEEARVNESHRESGMVGLIDGLAGVVSTSSFAHNATVYRPVGSHEEYRALDYYLDNSWRQDSFVNPNAGLGRSGRTLAIGVALDVVDAVLDGAIPTAVSHIVGAGHTVSDWMHDIDMAERRNQELRNRNAISGFLYSAQLDNMASAITIYSDGAIPALLQDFPYTGGLGG